MQLLRCIQKYVPPVGLHIYYCSCIQITKYFNVINKEIHRSHKKRNNFNGKRKDNKNIYLFWRYNKGISQFKGQWLGYEINRLFSQKLNIIELIRDWKLYHARINAIKKYRLYFI